MCTLDSTSISGQARKCWLMRRDSEDGIILLLLTGEKESTEVDEDAARGY